MRNFKDLFVSSLKEFKSLRCITLMAMFGALSIVIGYFFTFMPAPSVKISFTFLPNVFVYYLFGPVVGAIFGGTMDLLNFIVLPMGTFSPGITLNSILVGVLYGVFLYKKPLSLKRIVVVNVINMLTLDLIFKTFWLSILIPAPFMALLPGRALKAICMLPIESILLYYMIKGVEATGILRSIYNKKTKLS